MGIFKKFWGWTRKSTFLYKKKKKNECIQLFGKLPEVSSLIRWSARRDFSLPCNQSLFLIRSCWERIFCSPRHLYRRSEPEIQPSHDKVNLGENRPIKKKFRDGTNTIYSNLGISKFWKLVECYLLPSVIALNGKLFLNGGKG